MTLSTDRLKVTLAEPGTFPNTTCRFDRSGFITSVLLDGELEFCTSEPENLSHPSSGGLGLCSEFIAPLMCSEAAPDTFFPKPGIGLIKKKGQAPYCFYETYEVQPFPLTWNLTGNSAVFSMDASMGPGYGWFQKRQIALEGNRLICRTALRNTGSREIQAKEYCHNFLTIEHLPLGDGYHISLPGIRPQAGILPGTLKYQEQGFTFTGYNPSSALYSIPEQDIMPCDTFSWEMIHSSSKAGIKVTEGFRPCQVDIWAVDHLISVEVFYPICLLPGKKLSWERSWEFYNR